MVAVADPAQPHEQFFVPARLVQEVDLVEGATVTGPLHEAAHGRGPELAAVESVCGLAPELFRKRTPFPRLVAVDPHERLPLGAGGDLGMRLIDLVAPIGRGTRGLIVSPPKAGKTVLLQQIALALRAADPGLRLIVLLIDERPEEVTFFRRALAAEVWASSSDRSLQEHLALAEWMLAHIRTELECGRHIVLLLDSLTRLTRSFNLRGSDRSRTLSGGLEAGALEIPRRFFGLARAIEGGGSVTILATILVDTGSRLDQVIYEEFKGTGNCEIVLDRSLAEARLFPAVNLSASGTRKENLLHGPGDTAEEAALRSQRLARLRRVLAGRKPKEALDLMFQLLKRYPTNDDLLRCIPLES